MNSTIFAAIISAVASIIVALINRDSKNNVSTVDKSTVQTRNFYDPNHKRYNIAYGLLSHIIYCGYLWLFKDHIAHFFLKAYLINLLFFMFWYSRFLDSSKLVYDLTLLLGITSTFILLYVISVTPFFSGNGDHVMSSVLLVMVAVLCALLMFFIDQNK